MGGKQGAPIQRTGDWLSGFDDILDCRSPAEFAEDHLPGALNSWVLDDEQRARVGTVYKQEGAFAGRRLGAGLVSQNIGRHLQGVLANKGKDWRPLVYCWRGGQRSGAMATVLAQIGFRVTLLDGGYKAYRRRIIESLPALCARQQYVVLCGRTGVGKTRLLKALAASGQPVVDLEGLACHRGSLFGALGLAEQPSVAGFDTALYHALMACERAGYGDSPGGAPGDRSRALVWIEAESAKVGRLHLPKALVEAIRQAPRVDVEANLDDRVQTILNDYGSSRLSPAAVAPLVDRLPPRVPNADKATMRQLAENSAWAALSKVLIQQHYDPSYRRSCDSNFTGKRLGRVVVVGQDFDQGAKDCLALASIDDFS